MAKNKQFGKGLRALLENIETDASDISSVNKGIFEKTTTTSIPLEQIEVNPYQPRQDFEPEALKSLAESIAIHGLIQPITLRMLSQHQYQIISGERRFRAAKLANLKEVPAYIRKADDQGMLEMALIENTQRADLNPIEIALSLKRLLDECSLTHEELSNRVTKNRSTITNYVRLLKLPPSIQHGLKDKQISMGHARSLVGIDSPEVQLDLYREIVEKSLSVRATEKIVRQLAEIENKGKDKPRSNSTIDPEISRIQDRLSEYFGTKIKLQRNRKGAGQISIRFNSDKELNDILDRLED